MPSPCRAYAALCRGLVKSVSERLGRGMARTRHGHGMACVNQTRPHCVNQMGRHNLNPFWHGMGAAWERHSMCDLVFTRQWSPVIPSLEEKWPVFYANYSAPLGVFILLYSTRNIHSFFKRQLLQNIVFDCEWGSYVSTCLVLPVFCVFELFNYCENAVAFVFELSAIFIAVFDRVHILGISTE
jgi:hypothetical protein